MEKNIRFTFLNQMDDLTNWKQNKKHQKNHEFYPMQSNIVVHFFFNYLT